MPETGNTASPSLEQLAEQQRQEPGVAEAVAAYEAVEKVYFQAVAAAPSAVVASSYATTTNPR